MNLPALTICGYSGSGKTTLIEAIIPRLKTRGLRVAVLKHDAHGLRLDRAGKDSDRIFRAGADVVVRGPGESLMRRHADDGVDLAGALRLMIPFYDLILVEGHKRTPLLTKVWLRRQARDRPPSGIAGVQLDLGRECDRPLAVLRFLDAWLPRTWLRTPVYAGVLIGGQSRRMGKPKHLMRLGRRTWLEKVVSAVRPFTEEVVLLGRGHLPVKLAGTMVLPDAPGLAGPLAGMLSAMRWAPLVSWLFVACDLPLISAAAVKWLLATRAPGVWAAIPKSRAGFEPLFAHYDFRARPLLEAVGRPAAIIRAGVVLTPSLPPALKRACANFNSPADLPAAPAN